MKHPSHDKRIIETTKRIDATRRMIQEVRFLSDQTASAIAQSQFLLFKFSLDDQIRVEHDIGECHGYSIASERYL